MKEKTGLKISTSGNLIIGLVGVTIALLSSSQAIMLDGAFNLIYLCTGLFTLKVASLLHRTDNDRFPQGYDFFEPLINGIKGLMVLSISVMAVIGAIKALLQGGQEISVGLATLYGSFATIACWLLAIMTYRWSKNSNSPLLKADAENWMVNGAISSAVLLAFISMYLIQGTSLEGYIPYIDPLLVLIVVLLTIYVPIRMVWNALMQLLNRAPSKEIVTEVKKTVMECLSEMPTEETFIRVLQPGRTRLISAHVVLPPDYHVEQIKDLDSIRAKTQAELRKLHPATVLDIIFIGDRFWGAPINSLGETSPQTVA